MLSEKGKIKIWHLLLVASLLSYVLLKGIPIVAPGANNPAEPGSQVVPVTPDGSNPNLQAKTLTLITPNPTAYLIFGPECFHHYTNDCGSCCGGCLDSSYDVVHQFGPTEGQNYKNTYNNEKYWCDAKPVIYLYPLEKTIVDVKIDVPGKIVESIPLYPENGWKNILAYPDGKLVYKNKTYSELFYEASITPIDPPKNGIIVTSKTLKTDLQKFAEKLGFNKKETSELVEFWTPKLITLNSEYYFLSVFSPEKKELIDKVTINPQPATFIQYIFYFKPLSQKITVDEFVAPPLPQRIGFTAVEWGGIIDK